jgi:hypothetical protein
MMRIMLILVLALSVVGCGGNYTLDQKSFTPEKLKMVEQSTGVALPAGSKGLNMVYKGEPVDPYFVANIEIPENSHDELRGRIGQIRNEEIHVSGSPTTRFSWWKVSKETTRIERQFHAKPDYYVHLVLCEESGRWILYVEWFV